MKKHILHVAAVTLFLMGTGCPPVSPKPPVADGDADVALADADNGLDEDGAPRNVPCTQACVKLAFLGCPEAAKPDGGKTCYRLCADAEASGKFSLKPACVAAAKDVDGVRACGTVRCK